MNDPAIPENFREWFANSQKESLELAHSYFLIRRTKSVIRIFSKERIGCRHAIYQYLGAFAYLWSEAKN